MNDNVNPDAPAFSEQQQIVLKGNTFEKAGWWARLFALIIDFVITFIVNQPIGAALKYIFQFDPDKLGQMASQGNFEQMPPEYGYYILSSFGFSLLIGYLYLVIFYHIYAGTPGKMAMGIRVYTDEGEHVGFGRVILRDYIGKFLSGLLFGFGYFMPLFQKQGKALHDLIGSTVVVKHRPELEEKTADAPQSPE